MLLDDAGRLRVNLDSEGPPCLVTLDGRTGSMAHSDGEVGGADHQENVLAMRTPT